MVFSILYCKETDEIISLSEEAIHFWTLEDLKHTRSFYDSGIFTCFCLLENHSILDIGKIQRRIIFSDLKISSKIAMEISASPSKAGFKKMKKDQSFDCIQILLSKCIPLFNIPSAMCPFHSNCEDPNYSGFFVGDDFGRIEIFRFFFPMTKRNIISFRAN
jgi:hypothetical protein